MVNDPIDRCKKKILAAERWATEHPSPETRHTLESLRKALEFYTEQES